MKFVKFLLCASIFMNFGANVFASDNGMADALTQVKERIDTTEYDSFRSSYSQNDGEPVTYFFSWSNDEDQYSGLYTEFTDGIITSYSKYDGNDDGGFGLFSLSENEALEIADEFVKRINPDIFQNIKIVPEENRYAQNERITMNIYRTQSGIPVLGDSGYISVSKRTHEVLDFYINYKSGTEFKELDNIISTEEAKDVYKRLMPPTLRYKFRHDYDKKEISAYLEYAPKNEGKVINAYDGTIYDISYGGEIYYNKSMAAEDNAGDGGFTPAELEETERVAGLLSETQAVQLAKENEIIAIPKNCKLEYASLGRNWYNKNEYIYEFSFTDDDRYISVNIDAKSGEILSFYNYSSNYEEVKQDRKKEEQVAEKTFRIFAGEKASEFRMEEGKEAGTVVYVRTFDGIDVIGDGAYFDFDEKDNLSGYSLRYTKDVTFPSKDGVIAPEKAAEFACDKVGFGLAYAVNNEENTAYPVYCICKDGEIESFTMNPFSGQLTDYNGDDIKKPEKITYSDIDGHYGKDIFLTLSDYGIGFEGGALKPDEPITQAEYFKLLNKVFGYEADTDEIYRQMIVRGTIPSSERADNSILTRENAALIMVREMGAEEYAKYNDIFAEPFLDVSENKGYIAILKAKGIINGDGSGYFYPQKTVTRGETLIMIYNCFAK